MLQKNKIIIFSALAISLLLNIPRFLIMLSRKDLVAEFGFTYGEAVVRLVVMFLFSWLVLTYNIHWKVKWKSSYPLNTPLFNVLINAFFLFAGVVSLTFLKRHISEFALDEESYLFVTFFIYLVVLILLLLLSWLVNLSFQHQQSIIEKEQAKRKALHHQLEALRSQINPHFLFNTLNSLSTLIRQQPDKASVFVRKLSSLLRATLQQSDKDYTSLDKELDYLEAYIFLQKERFGDKLDVEISIPNHLKKCTIPSFSLQLLVENAIKHNVVSSKQPLQVKVYIEGNFLLVSNPVQKRSDAVESIGKGLSSLSTRFQLLKKEDIQIEKTDQLFLVKLPLLGKV